MTKRAGLLEDAMTHDELADRYENIASVLWSGDVISASYLENALKDPYDAIQAEALDYLIHIGKKTEFIALVKRIASVNKSSLVNNRLRVVYAIYGIYDKQFYSLAPIVTDADVIWHYAARYIESRAVIYKDVIAALSGSHDMQIKSLSANITKLIKLEIDRIPE